MESLEDKKREELHAAARSSDAEELKRLLNENVPAHLQDNETGRSALMEAAGAGSATCVALLLEYGAPWNALDREGRCAGEYAYDAGSQECVDKLVNAGVRAQLLFGLLGNTETTDDRSTAEYLGSDLQQKDDSLLLDASGDAVMMEWETPLMEAHADVMCGRFPHEWISSEGGGTVLNIGHGLGIIDGFIRDRQPEKHTIIEPHPAVLNKMRKEGWMDHATVIETTWQEAINNEDFGPFDAIFFDTYAEDYNDMRSFFHILPRLLKKPDGLFSYFNGIAPFNSFFHGVACQLIQVELSQLGLQVDFVPIKVDKLPEHVWNGVKRKYWLFDTYHLPIARWSRTVESAVPTMSSA